MVYSDKFVVSVVCSGDIVREIRQNGGDTVYLPFGSDYSLRFKNLHTQRAVVSVEIDGKDVLDGHGLVVDPNSKGELLGFMEGSRVRNNFRFIKKTQQVADHRGDLIDDGFIRIAWRFEEPPRITHTHHDHHHHHDYHYHHDYYYRHNNWLPQEPILFGESSSFIGNSTRCNSNGKSFTRGILPRATSKIETSGATLSNTCAESEPQSFLDSDESGEGITVKGQDAYQSFNSVGVGTLGEEHVIVLHLQGKNSKGQKLTKPKLVRTKTSCSSCGTKNNSGNKFCLNCGTRLI